MVGRLGQLDPLAVNEFIGLGHKLYGLVVRVTCGSDPVM